ncbi:serine/threonine-protein kinase [Kitasatospora sp. NPDC096147]|uniref:serine/threonine-protein kinase n=1 Tax=Kitasatospora sp. NPDC096147 TaxID=3364093 RepID=UPI0037F331AA
MQAGDVLDGKYRLVAELGRGGFGVVWRAEDTRLGREIAIKVISEAAYRSPADLERFTDEARAVASLNHPYIVTLHDIGESEGLSYLVMELVRGRPLSALARQVKLELPQVLGWLGQVCEALAAAHRAGVVHRDIKPENIMIADSGTAKVLDFGIARLAGRPGGGLTTVGTVIGSPPYMAPERWRGDPVDGRTDLYSVGCLLYELCVGTPPFGIEEVFVLMHRHVADPPPRPRERVPGLPAELEELILDLLAKDPEQRPADGLTVARRLAAVPLTTPAELRRRADESWAVATAGAPGEAARRLWALVGEFARVCGPDDPRTLRACHDLALCFAADGRPAAAAGLLADVLATGVTGLVAEDAARDLARFTARLTPGVGSVAGQLALLVGRPAG